MRSLSLWCCFWSHWAHFDSLSRPDLSIKLSVSTAIMLQAPLLTDCSNFIFKQKSCFFMFASFACFTGEQVHVAPNYRSESLTIDFCALTLDPATLLNSLVNSRIFYSLGEFLMYIIMTSAYREYFIYSFSNYTPFISFYCFIALVRIFSTMSKECRVDILICF